MIHNFSQLRDRFNSRFNSADKPTIGLAGFYGYGNYGDELFLDVWEKYLGADFNLRILHDLELKPFFSERFNDQFNSVDGIIIGGGDILQPWNIDRRYWNRRFLEKPVWIAGIGVPLRANAQQAEKENVINKMSDFLTHDNVRLIHSRDAVSHKWINARFPVSTKSFWSPDIVASLKEDFFKKREASSRTQKKLGIVVRSRKGHEDSDNFSLIEGFAERSFAKGWDISIIVLATGRTLKPDLDSSLRLNIDAPTRVIFSDSIHTLTSELMCQDAILSMKFHGTVAAMMAGIPSIVGVPTLKNREFTKQLGVPDLCIGFESQKLASIDANMLKPPKLADIDNVFHLASDAVSRIGSDLRKFFCKY